MNNEALPDWCFGGELAIPKTPLGGNTFCKNPVWETLQPTKAKMDKGEKAQPVTKAKQIERKKLRYKKTLPVITSQWSTTNATRQVHRVAHFPSAVGVLASLSLYLIHHLIQSLTSSGKHSGAFTGWNKSGSHKMSLVGPCGARSLLLHRVAPATLSWGCSWELAGSLFPLICAMLWGLMSMLLSPCWSGCKPDLTALLVCSSAAPHLWFLISLRMH